jgi:succinate dehydrogenase hydrophobic anchor subunit
MQSGRIVQPGWNLDYLMFLFTRISGASIILLAFIGMASAFWMGARLQLDAGVLMRWTFFPNPNHVVASVPDVTLGWANAYWQVMQMLIVFFGATHGYNGLRVILEEYLHGTVLHLFIRALLFLLWIAIMIVGVYVILAS